MSTLVIIPSDRISDWIKKGEVTNRYYNPGNLFDVIHLVLLNDEYPDPIALKKLAGKAEIFAHTYPTGVPHFVQTFGWSKPRLKRWAQPIVDEIVSWKPNLVRCHGATINAFLAHELKLAGNIPYVVSLHINPDTDIRGRKMGLLRRIRDQRLQKFESLILRDSDLVMPVYRPIIPFLDRIGGVKYEVAYNFLNDENILPKENYQLHNPIRIISVGRQFEEKNPDNLIRAVAKLPGVELTLVGNGSYHEYLKGVAKEVGISNRTIFRPVVSNDELCRSLRDYDIFSTHTEYWEISKSVLEPMLTGLPIVLNRRLGEPVPEFNEGICQLVDNTVDGYFEALDSLIKNSPVREGLGRKAREYANLLWSPKVTEKKFSQIYQKFLEVRTESR